MADGTELLSRFLATSQADPDRLALRTRSLAVTYRELGQRAGGIAGALASARPGPVLVLATNGPDLAASALGILGCGRAVVPADPRSGACHLAALASTVGASAVVSSDTGLAAHLDLPPGTAIVSPVAVAPEQLLAQDVDERAEALIGSTSGSTGPPKLRRESRRSLLLRVTRRAPPAPTEGERLGMLLGATHSAVKRLLNVLTLGGTVSCLDARSDTFTQILEGFAAHRVTYLHLVPTYLRELCEAAGEEAILPGLRVLATSGEALDWRDVANVRRIAPSALIRHTYGTTETGRIAECLIGPGEPLRRGTVPVGHPVIERQVWLEADDGTPARPGEPGEVVVEGQGFREGVDVEVLASGRERYRTGDVGRFAADGQLVLLGRRDRLMKLGGIRVEPCRIEEVLREADEVGHVVVLAESTHDGEGRIVAHLGGRPDRPELEADLRGRIERTIHAAAVPSRFEWHADGLPMLANGKVDVARLRGGDPGGLVSDSA